MLEFKFTKPPLSTNVLAGCTVNKKLSKVEINYIKYTSIHNMIIHLLFHYLFGSVPLIIM